MTALEPIDPYTRTTTAGTINETARPFKGRRLTWAEFETLTGRKRPEAANDNASPPTSELRQRAEWGPRGSLVERNQVDELPRRMCGTGGDARHAGTAEEYRASLKADVFPIRNMGVK